MGQCLRQVIMPCVAAIAVAVACSNRFPAVPIAAGQAANPPAANAADPLPPQTSDDVSKIQERVTARLVVAAPTTNPNSRTRSAPRPLVTAKEAEAMRKSAIRFLVSRRNDKLLWESTESPGRESDSLSGYRWGLTTAASAAH